MSPNPKTRDQILAFLHNNGPSSAREVARALDVTVADVRYHLVLLMKEGKVQKISPPPGQRYGRGRPQSLFVLVSSGGNTGINWLYELLLEYLSQENETTLEKISHLATKTANLPSTTNLLARLNDSMQFLNQQGYAAHWEASQEGPRIFLSRCPFWPLPLHHHILCALDRLILEGLCRLPLSQCQRINMATRHPAACVFRIREPVHPR